MRTVYVQELMRLPLGKQGENGVARIVWQGLAARYQALYGSGAFTLAAKRCGDAAAYPVAVSTEGGDVVWLVRAADVANPGSGSCELTYTVDGAVAKSQTWSTYVAASISGDAPGEPPEEPAKAWFAAIQAQIGNLDDLTTKARASLVAAINEAAKTGSGGAGSISMRTADGYIQYSTDDGANWANLIALAELKGAPGQDGAPGKDGEPGKDGHTPKIAATKTGKTTSITADGLEIAQIKDGEDAAAAPSLGITGAQVGQIAKITAVDASGVPTAWSPVDMPSGGGETWETINVITLSDAVNTVAINQDSGGNAIALKKVCILVVGSATANQDLFLNNSRYIRAAVVGMAASVGALSAEPFCGKMYCFAVTNISANYASISQLANIFSEEITITEIKLLVNNSGTFSAGTKFTIQGVRA